MGGQSLAMTSYKPYLGTACFNFWSLDKSWNKHAASRSDFWKIKDVFVLESNSSSRWASDDFCRVLFWRISQVFIHLINSKNKCAKQTLISSTSQEPIKTSYLLFLSTATLTSYWLSTSIYSILTYSFVQLYLVPPNVQVVDSLSSNILSSFQIIIRFNFLDI